MSTSPSVWMRSTVMSVHSRISETKRPNFANFFVFIGYIDCSRGSVHRFLEYADTQTYLSQYMYVAPLLAWSNYCCLITSASCTEFGVVSTAVPVPKLLLTLELLSFVYLTWPCAVLSLICCHKYVSSKDIDNRMSSAVKSENSLTFLCDLMLNVYYYPHVSTIHIIH